MKYDHWTEGPFVAFDTETTGTDPCVARILQAAIITYDPKGIRREEDDVIYIDPGIPIPPEAIAIHGITADKLRKEKAWEAKSGVEHVSRILHDRSSQRGYPCVIYNTTYDYPLLLAECQRHGIEVGRRPMFLDPLVIDRALDKYRRGSRKLGDTARFYGVRLDAAHGALADATAALAIMRALIKIYPHLKTFDLPTMQKMQVNWHTEWRDRINTYRGRIGNTNRVTGNWPI